MDLLKTVDYLHVWRPHCDCALAVAEQEDGVGGVLAHDVQPAQPSVRLLYDLAHRDVEPGQVARLVGPGQQEMVGKVFQVGDVVHLLDAVDLDALVVVHVSPLFLGDREEVLGVEPADSVHRLHGIDLAHQGLRVPVEGGQVALPPPEQQVFSIP